MAVLWVSAFPGLKIETWGTDDPHFVGRSQFVLEAVLDPFPLSQVRQ
jgi:hypothetical protein